VSAKFKIQKKKRKKTKKKSKTKLTITGRVSLRLSLLYQNNRTFTQQQQLFARILRAKRYAHQS